MNREKIILANFLENSNTYAENVLKWANAMRSVEIEIGESNKYITDKNGAGLFFNDGNPIFNNMNLDLKKSFRIIQENPRELSEYSESEIKKIKEIEAWISKTKIIHNGIEIELNELVISLFLTSDSIEKVKSIVKNWYSNRNYEDFKIEDYI